MECREAAEYLPAYVDLPAAQGGTGGGVRGLEDHLVSCASCRADLSEYRSLTSSLATLVDQPIQPPAWLAASVTDAVRSHLEHRVEVPLVHAELPVPAVVARNRGKAAGGAIVLGLAAGALGAFLVRGRRRKRRSLASALRTAAAGA